MNDVMRELGGSSVSRRQVIVGAAATGMAWSAPSIVTMDRVEAAVGSSCVTTTNLALLGSASQVSTKFRGTADRANDGNRNGNFRQGSVAFTGSQIGAWWEVDLGSVRQIDEVWVYNRTDCCSARTQSVQIDVDGVLAASMTGVVGTPSIIPLGCMGQVVRVTNGLATAVTMQLAEVEVYGC